MCVLRRELTVPATIFPPVRSCRYRAICPGKASSWRRAVAFAAWSCWLAARAYATSPSCFASQSGGIPAPGRCRNLAEELGQGIGIAGQGADRRLREVRVTTQPGFGLRVCPRTRPDRIAPPARCAARPPLRSWAAGAICIAGASTTGWAKAQRPPVAPGDSPCSRRCPAGGAGDDPRTHSARTGTAVLPVTVARIPIEVLLTVILPGQWLTAHRRNSRPSRTAALASAFRRRRW